MINGLPERLKELRMKHGFTQRHVAKRVNVAPSVVSGYETGEKTPSMEVLISLSYLYNCSTDFLLGKNHGESTLIIDTKGLSDKQIKAITVMVEAMKDK